MARRRAASIQYEQTYKHILKEGKARKCRFPIPASDFREMSPAKHLSKLVMPDQPWKSSGSYQLRHRDGLFGSRTPQ
ncbi:putative cytochrome b5 domain-containing protein [Clavispora lusitaniae]|uniref:Cytochrome b5 domain-containing protein n=1 Tax=Clavispora lusitaniae TaxID=36911 RepID=A0ACD0WLB0_CLALS|nr:putative cytochrome b5 domain-containing protein [Clavispora lusitaniae]QFZ33685.1 putative cytochrome b5 domain-containing protein [Clavispora lusitaniae]QFZ39356.1 putative cytochrome b5 domain-containing protein [Clavispora lusitaniae]QFZ45038.1 putative cytochrome b5 domain-containing protein [Clavispora lusitaniae]QFZ50715.1 putative cytochrome b5 domain-containing protein [Clavispora lusitaniae]